MYRVLVVDDEKLVRSTIKAILASHSRYQVVAETGDGEQAFKLCKDLQPHILITDVRMPGLGGLELIRLIRDKRSWEGRCIVISAYDDFGYVQEALKLGAKDYLLKPIFPEELLGVLDKLAGEIEWEIQRRKAEEKLRDRLAASLPYIKMQFICDLINQKRMKRTELEELVELLGLPKVPFPGIVVNIDDFRYRTRGLSQGRKQELKQAVFGIIETTMSASCETMVAPFSLDSFLILPCIAGGHSKERVIELAQELKDLVHQRLDVTVSVGIGRVYEEPELLAQSCQEALLAERYKFYSGGDVVIHIDDVNPQCELLGETYPRHLEKALLNNVTLGNSQGAVNSLNKIVDHLEVEQVPPELVRQTLGEILVLVSRAALEGGADFNKVASLTSCKERLGQMDTAKTLRPFITAIVEELTDLVAASVASYYERIIEKAVVFINENYSCPISLEEVAGIVNLSPNYFSRLFCKTMGVSFIEYVKQKRIESALQMLRQGNMSVKEISTQVGYNNQNYFSQVFRDTVGMTPTEYRKKSS